MPEKKGGTTTISAKVDGIAKSEVPLKAVAYLKHKQEIEILAEQDVDQDEFELDVGREAKELPQDVELAVVPREVAFKSHIQRLAKAGHVPAMTVKKELLLARRGRVVAEDLTLKSVGKIETIFSAKQRVCGRVIRRDPVTGEVCGVPGATVRVLDVDLHLFWWYPYPGYPWFWIWPFWPRREEIAVTKTDRCGRFCVDIPRFDIDAIIRWRLRWRCMWPNLARPRVLDAIEKGIKPDLERYRELAELPELTPVPQPAPGPEVGRFAPPRPVSFDTTDFVKVQPLEPKTSRFFTEPKFQLAREALFGNRAMFDPVDEDRPPVLERPAFPESIAAPALPDDEHLLTMLPDKEMLPALRHAHPLTRLLLCWPEIVPEKRLILDIPDIVFKVEQDVDGDGVLETVYDEGYFDVNWNLSESTTNVEIEAWKNAICVPCGPAYTPCTKTGIVGINEMPVTPSYLSGSGYALRVNRPKPVPIPFIRPAAKTPFCGTVRLVGCPQYRGAKYYRLFYSYEGQRETLFKRSWFVHRISTDTPHYVTHDANGYYPVLSPANDYFPYHTLLNWPTYAYPDGRYRIHLELYNAAKARIWPTGTPTYVHAVVDNRQPTTVDFVGLRWRRTVSGASWNSLPLNCPIIRRPEGEDIELRVTYHVAAHHLRDLRLGFYGCALGNPLIDSYAYWHQTVGDNSRVESWTTTLSGTSPPGAYRFHLSGRSRAFRPTGGLATNWYYDPLHIWRTNNLPIAILDA
jgi:hypothetical protein